MSYGDNAFQLLGQSAFWPNSYENLLMKQISLYSLL